MRGLIVIAIIVLVLVGVAVLRMRKREAPPSSVVQFDPHDILFSLPTLCDVLPATTEDLIPSDAEVVLEDDWRQIEFVSVSDREAVDTQLAELRDFRIKHQKGPAWDSIYVRKDRAEALAPANLAWADVKKHLVASPHETLLALDTMGQPRLVRGGFARTIARGLVLYGQRDGDHLRALGLVTTAQELAFASAQPVLQAICDELHVDVVDWYRAKVPMRASS